LASLDPAVVSALANFGILIASREDLVADAATPFDQLRVLREAFGRGPVLVVTDGPAGLWIDVSGVGQSNDYREHMPAPWVVDGADVTGAGDVLAAFLVTPTGPLVTWRTRANEAMRMVAEELEARKNR
jgi:sugar/nucleoside kinase (ribokinase family)